RITPRLRTLTYVLAASVYCTAWTFYGSVGLAAHHGLEFLTIYLGPALVALLWPTVLRKLVRVAKEQRITTISDFIGSRYGKSAGLGTLVAALVVCGMIPYIALQLKAVSVSFRMMMRDDPVLSGFDPTLLVAVTLALFGILFGARNLDFTREQTGLMAAVAVESIVKLVAFLVVGAFVTWGLFGGFGDVFARAAADPRWAALLTLDTPPAASHARWAAMLLVSMIAVMLLPRQFHVLVVQNPRERDVRTAAWAFPLYLLVINVFVLPVALGGLLLTGGAAGADSFILGLPLRAEAFAVAVIVFLGGFSAATAMIVVDSLALGKMISNDIVLPFILRGRRVEEVYWASLNSTRLGMLVVVLLGYLWARVEASSLLVEMGLLSFLAVAQCAPAVFLGLYWRGGSRAGACAGISVGFAAWFYTLIVPNLVKDGVLPATLLATGPFGLAALRPTALLGVEGLDPLTHGVFWSLLLNVAAYLLVSVLTEQDAEERSQAAAFVGAPEADPARARVGAILSVPEIERLIHLYVPEKEAEAILATLLDGKAPRELTLPELLEMRIRLERILAASLGAAAARYIIEDRFTISKDEAQALVESFQGMQRSLRQSERLLASVVESVDDCIVTTDAAGRVITINPAGQRLLEWPPAPGGRTYLDVLDDADRGRVGRAIERAVAEGRAWRGGVTGVARGGRR
ncbi:MAG TPA: PAS domain-containing protein, partial [Candidatus Tectomicrobia bacterium]|nr:PAS domain-containing protein [Candidatus Tectomicrobia bacterium]